MQKDVRLTYTGHSTVMIEMDGIRLLTDPLLRRRVAHLGRLVAAPNIADWDLDAILISHMHWDHLDLPSLRLLGADTRLIVPKGSARYLRRKGFQRVEEIDRNERIRIGNVTIQATMANHPGERPFWGPSVDSLGYLIQGSQEIYFAGDTDLFPEMAAISSEIDVALIPVWGYGPILGSGHLDPIRAAQSLPDVAPRVVIPIHWGTYCPIGMVWMQLPFMHVPPHLFKEHAQIIAPQVDVKILEPGQSFLPLS